MEINPKLKILSIKDFYANKLPEIKYPKSNSHNNSCKSNHTIASDNKHS